MFCPFSGIGCIGTDRLMDLLVFVEMYVHHLYSQWGSKEGRIGIEERPRFKIMSGHSINSHRIENVDFNSDRISPSSSPSFSRSVSRSSSMSGHLYIDIIRQ